MKEMTVDPELIEILVCPETRQRVRPADAETLAAVNRAIAAGRARNRAGETLREPIEVALVREDGGLLYPVSGGIPVMLPDQAVALPVE